MAEWDALLPEVKAYMDTHRDGYQRFLDRLIEDTNRIRHGLECSPLIYSIYSRREKQRGDPFKKDEKIAKKLYEWRDKTPDARLQDIHDIIGITIVVNFPSDRDRVADYIASDRSGQCFEVYKQHLRKDKGYYAMHLLVRPKNALQFPVQRAEIQIKTMLHDGWGAKTHDLTYKPQGEIDRILDRHMQILGDVLQHLDDQSELIKMAIQDRWQADRRRRYAAREQLFWSLTNSSNAAHAQDLRELAQAIKDERDELAILDLGDPRFMALADRLRKLAEKLGAGPDVSRLYTYLASIRAASDDVTAFALNAIDEWQNVTIGDARAQARVEMFRSLTYYAVGQLEKAVISSRRALLAAASAPDVVPQAKSNLAYFLAELLYDAAEKDAALVDEALRLSDEALREASATALPSAKDTRGAVLIALGATEHDVRTGLQLCLEAKAAASSQRSDVLEAFFRLHERRAFRRLLSME
ncbi:MAG TPA: RelA/SpoT domain-containing protein [Acetobacteraceae bacterium]|jgi:ppGpp synthetase/RelA/SpoT-type nucleotidyltranferase